MREAPAEIREQLSAQGILIDSKGSSTAASGQCSSNLRVQQRPLEVLLKCRFMDPAPRKSVWKL